MILTIVGGGNGGHVLAALAGAQPHVTVRILSRRPELFASKMMTVERPGIGGGSDITGRIASVSARPEDVVPGSDVVIWCGPVVATGKVFEMLAPFIVQSPRPMYVGCLFGQGCVHLLAKKYFGADTPFFCFQNIPWLCRTITPGQVCSIVGRKVYTAVACHKCNFTWLKKALEPCLGGPTMTALHDFAAIVLNPANQIIHPARYWGIFKEWDGQSPLPVDSIPWLYRDFDDASAEALEGLDCELQTIKAALLKNCPELDLTAVIPLKNRIIAQYGAQVKDQSSLKQVMATNQAYSMAKTPVKPISGGVIPNPQHRVVEDDIPHGLCVLKDIAEQLGHETPWIDRMIVWHQQLMGKSYLVGGRFVGPDRAECSALSVLGGTSLSNIGFVSAPAIPCKL